MIFSSAPFFLFFVIYFLLHLSIPIRWRLTLIIIGSSFFYGYWNPWDIWIPYLLAFLAFLGAHWIERRRETPYRVRRLAVVVGLLLMPLAIMKYTNFFYQDVLGFFLGFQGKLVDWRFPIGISFITFTVIAYVVDVYRGIYHLEKRPALLCGQVLFFPHLIAGPILRPHDLLPQLEHPRRATDAFGVRVVFGLAIFSVGLLKKLVFADTLAEAVNAVFENGNTATSVAGYLLAWYGFTLQIYCDFSGYTDMAIGLAIMLGVHLPQNFQHPYTAASIIDFWRRWHITLSRWLRDYVYIPLGGNRRGPFLEVRNILITLGLGGLWHGANWTFVLWGLLHGLGISCAHLLSRLRFGKHFFSLPRWFRVLITFHFVCIGFILFRAPDLVTAWRVLTGPFVAPLGDINSFVSIHVFQLALLVIFFIAHPWDTHRNIRRIVRTLPPLAYWSTLLLIWVFAFAISQDTTKKFIYFDF
jgi:alginate O-acetyltransferase complex protein AlgI